MVEVYSRAVRERFIASRWSLAYLFRLAWYIGLAVGTLYIAYSSGGFWRRSDIYLEQPLVRFTKDLIVVGQAADGTRVLQYSTIERFNYLVGYDNVRQPALRTWSTDSNLDSRPDTIDVNLVFPLTSSDAPIVSVSLLLFFQCALTHLVNVDMNALVSLQSASNGVAGNKWVVMGNLQFVQQNPLSRTSSRGVRNLYKYPVVNDSTLIVLEDTDLGNIILNDERRNGQKSHNIPSFLHTQRHREREKGRAHTYTQRVRGERLAHNDCLLACFRPSLLFRRCCFLLRAETLDVTRARQVWSKTASSSFNISVHLRVPDMSIAYIPGPSEAIKFGWVQYISCFWILYFGLTFVVDFVYDQNVVETTRMVDGTPLAKLHHF